MFVKLKKKERYTIIFYATVLTASVNRLYYCRLASGYSIAENWYLNV